MTQSIVPNKEWTYDFVLWILKIYFKQKNFISFHIKKKNICNLSHYIKAMYLVSAEPQLL